MLFMENRNKFSNVSFKWVRLSIRPAREKAYLCPLQKILSLRCLTLSFCSLGFYWNHHTEVLILFWVRSHCMICKNFPRKVPRKCPQIFMAQLMEFMLTFPTKVDSFVVLWCYIQFEVTTVDGSPNDPRKIVASSLFCQKLGTLRRRQVNEAIPPIVDGVDDL